MASTGTSSEIFALEVIDSTLHVDTVRGKPRTWYVAATSSFRFDSRSTRGIKSRFLLVLNRFHALRCFLMLFFFLKF